MTRRHHSDFGVLALLGALTLAAGCTSDTCTCPGGTDETGYPDQSTPDNVIVKLEMAYEATDTEGYAECLAEDFVFFLHPDDVASEPWRPEYWTKQEEGIIHSHAFSDTSAVESIELTMVVVSTDSLPGDDPGDPSDDLWQYDVDIDLRVEVPGVTFLAAGPSRFVMRRSPDRDEVAWQIVEHRDLDEEGREESTWTTIKLCFGGPIDESLYPLRTCPANVMAKLALAYNRMDAEAYLDCLAEDLLFFLNPNDVDENPELPESWGKAEEAVIHGNMFGEATDVQGVALILTHVMDSWEPNDPDDPLDDEYTYLEDVDLRVQLPPDLTLHASCLAEFLIKSDPNEVGHGGEHLWEIVRWWDSSGWGARNPGPATEDSSWGGIKALYR